MNVIGIDPGINGGIAAVSSTGKLLLCQPTPTIGKEYDIPGMVRLLKKFVAPSFIVYLEQSQAMPKQGVSSTFKTGYGFGLWHGIATALGIPLVLVTPRRWMKEMFKDVGGDSTKNKSAIVASRLFPDFCFMPGRRRKPHDGMTDAACIAYYGIKSENKGGVIDGSE